MKLIKNLNIIKLFKIIIVFFTATVIAVTCFFTANAIERRFFYPTKYKDVVLRCADRYFVDPYLIYAVIKVESDFNPNAISKKQAKGLMQLTDKTANYVASMLKVNNYDIFDVNVNIEFGVKYLSYLIDRFNSVNLAIIAYNAGEGNLTKWLNTSDDLSETDFINSIPFNETRNYFDKICKTHKKYKKLYPQIVDK